MEQVKLMICGNSGIGKTTTILSLLDKVGENTSPIKKALLIDTEKGMYFRLKAMKIDTEKVDYVQISTVADMTDIYNKCIEKYNNNTLDYDLIVIDSLQAFQKKGLNKFVVGKELSKNMISSPSKPKIQDWGDSLHQMVALVELFIELGKHVVITAIASLHENVDIAGNVVEPPYYIISLPKSQRAIIPSLPDIVMLLEMKGKKVVCKTQQIARYPFVKNRICPEFTEGREVDSNFLREIFKKVENFS